MFHKILSICKCLLNVYACFRKKTLSIFVRVGKKYAMTMKIPNHLDQSKLHQSIKKEPAFRLKKKKIQTIFSNDKNVHINFFHSLRFLSSLKIKIWPSHQGHVFSIKISYMCIFGTLNFTIS